MNKKSILITGASGEIGMAIAHTFAKAGYTLALTGNQHFSKLKDLKIQIEKDYQVPVAISPCDLSIYEEVVQMTQYFIQSLGGLDAYIHVAGRAYYGLLQEMDLEDFHNLYQINLFSAFYLGKALLPHFIQKQNGRILHISSIWGNVGASMEAAYASTKSALHGLTKSLAKEVAPSHIQVNALAPGMVDTSMNAHLSTEDIEAICEEIPFGKMATPQEVAQMSLQILESPHYLTGQIIQMDGGWY